MLVIVSVSLRIDVLRQIELSAGVDPYVVHGRAVCLGSDVVVLLWGGAAHVGAVAVAQPPGGAQAEPIVIVLPGHREDVVVRDTASRMASALGRSVVVSAGMHWDDITPEGIAQAVANSEQVVDKLIAELVAAGVSDNV